MDATQSTDRGVEDRVFADEAALQDRNRRMLRGMLWAIVWGVPVVAVIVGISLTASGTVEQFEPAGEGVFNVTLLAVWPAGLVLLSVGLLGVLAAAIATLALAAPQAEQHGRPSP